MSRIPIIDLSQAQDAFLRGNLLSQLRDALFNVGFLYIRNHGVPEQTINNLVSKLPTLFDLPQDVKQSLSKLNSPHFLGYSGFAEEITLGKNDLREQFDFATELPAIWQDPCVRQRAEDPSLETSGRDLTQPYWRLRGPNQWPPEDSIPGFRAAFKAYHDAVQGLSYNFVHLIEEAFGISTGTFDGFFLPSHGTASSADHDSANGPADGKGGRKTYMPPQHRVKLLKYPPISNTNELEESQGVGAHKDSSGWLTFLYQVPRHPTYPKPDSANESQKEEEEEEEDEEGEASLQVLSPTSSKWLPAPPIPNTFVVNFGKAMESATSGAVRATVHRVRAPSPTSPVRYSIPFFQGLPLDMTMSEIRAFIPEDVRGLRRRREGLGDVEGPSEEDMDSWTVTGGWDSLGRAQLRKWVKSHPDVGRKWYGHELVDAYSA